jgi:hypothetical protein
MVTKQEKKQIKKILLVAFALLLLAIPIIFAWHIEIGWEVRENTHFTNGWIIQDIMKIYHIQLYSLLLINSFAAGYIIMGLIKEG